MVEKVGVNMNRLKKELIKRGIIGASDPWESFDWCEHLVFTTKDFIVTRYCCEVLDPLFKIYDKNFTMIAEQACERDEQGWHENPWWSMVKGANDE